MCRVVLNNIHTTKNCSLASILVERTVPPTLILTYNVCQFSFSLMHFALAFQELLFCIFTLLLGLLLFLRIRVFFGEPLFKHYCFHKSNYSYLYIIRLFLMVWFHSIHTFLGLRLDIVVFIKKSHWFYWKVIRIRFVWMWLMIWKIT